MRDGIGHPPAFLLAAAALDFDGDELGSALAIAHDCLGEVPRDVRDYRLELEQITARAGRRAASRRREDERIIGRGIAVDRHAIERALRYAGEHRLQGLARDPRV